MKKSLLALAVLTAAGSVNAATILDSDGVKVDVTGAAEVQYYKDFSKDKNAYLRMDDGDINFATTVEVADGLSAVAGIGFEFEKGATSNTGSTIGGTNGNVENDELFVGLSSNFGTTTFGRQITVSDDAGIGEDYELGTESLDFSITEGEEVIKHKFEGENYWLAGSIASTGQGSKGTTQSAFDFGAGVTFNAFEARVFFQSASDVNNVAGADLTAWNLEGVYSVDDALSLAASFGTSELETNGTTTNEVDVIAFAATYQMDDKNTIAGGLNLGEQTVGSAASVDATNFYVNITHKLHSNVKAYAELGFVDIDNQDHDTGYLAGLEVSF
ncbi:porin [Vibrio sp. Of7-15]|uniref:porin n=1 Tax=Vibrio sp. Of7-15 TaxID=2724879 RepID=UPI001EF284AD|nr:porin [Vibrio sp. Of7-15]MCG7495960.1 porin [Vibrio sp. Of7-15]